MKILEKNKMFLLQKKTNKSFVINNDIELLEKLKESEENYKKTGISYTFEESYKKGIDFIDSLICKNNV